MARILVALVAALAAASLSDWLFMGVLFHDRYLTYPEVWRSSQSERARIIVAQLYTALTAIGFVWLAASLAPLGFSSALELAALVWLIGPLPLLLSNHLFIKLDPAVTATHAVGWLVKLLLIGGITATLLNS